MMEATIMQSLDNFTEEDFCKFISEGLRDVHDGNLLDFDATFDELEKRYDADD